jgi:hypothetical protein
MQSASVLFLSSQNGRSVILTINHHAVNASYVPTRNGAAAMKQSVYLASLKQHPAPSTLAFGSLGSLLTRLMTPQRTQKRKKNNLTF